MESNINLNLDKDERLLVGIIGLGYVGLEFPMLNILMTLLIQLIIMI